MVQRIFWSVSHLQANWWDTHSLAQYWDGLEDVLVRVELDAPKDKTLIIRLQDNLKKQLEQTAKRKGLSASTLARMWLMEKLQPAH